MDEETKYRVEDPDQVEDEMPGIMKPLPSSPETRRKRGKRPVPIVKFFGVTMKETSRDNLLLIMIPLLVALIDANVFSWIIVGILEESSVYMFVIPLFAAIPVGLLMANTGRTIGGAVLTAIFFAVLIVGFIVIPSSFLQPASLADFLLSATVVASVYVLFVFLASLLGSIAGMLLREFL